MTVQRFIKQVFTIAIAFLVSLFFLCVVGIFVFTKITSTDSGKIKDHTVLSFTMGGRVIESMPVSLLGSNKGMINFKAVTQAIRQATQDGRIRAIYLDLSYLNAGWPVLEEIRADLLAFKKAGKTIVAYADYYTQRSYYLAALADKIVLNPSGFLEFKGLSATVTFYTKALQNLSIKPVIFRLGTFKSAVEPYSLTKMSKESRQQTSDCVYSIYNHFLNKIGEARGISPDVLKEHANNLSAVAPSDALDANLITTIGYATDAKTFLKEKNKDGSFVNYAHYNASLTPPDLANKIAVLTAEGTIIDGQGSAGYVGSKDFVKTLKAAQKDSDIKAVVLRINSPGGSVIASDVIWKAVEALKVVKPVVVSMSNVAASGGYYIAAPSNYIFAQATTITGSIGIFGLLFDPSELVHKIGIDHDVVKTAPSADFLEGFPFPRVTCSELESKFMYKMLQQSYDAFLAKVAAGRGLDVTCVEKLAGGRVYTGAVAKQNGLVDELGGLEEAIAKAASLANLNAKYAITYLPRPKTKLEQLLSYTTDTIKTELLDSFVQTYPVLNHYQMLSRPYSLQAMLPYTMHID